jgi:nicotinamidase-related amidase
VVAGAVTSLCVDATARSAAALGYRVTVLGDCTVPMSSVEQALFCEEIFPMYGDVMDSATFATRMAGHDVSR